MSLIFWKTCLVASPALTTFWSFYPAFNPDFIQFLRHLRFTRTLCMSLLWLLNTKPLQVKFEFSEKATKFEKIFVILLTRALCSVHATAYLSKSRRRFFKTNVDKLYNTNFRNEPLTSSTLFSSLFGRISVQGVSN